jgi:hypothetical protein
MNYAFNKQFSASCRMNKGKINTADKIILLEDIDLIIFLCFEQINGKGKL